MSEVEDIFAPGDHAGLPRDARRGGAVAGSRRHPRRLGSEHRHRNQAEWLAGEGYLALAPDLYYWSSRIRCLVATVRLGARARGDLDATRTWLAEQDRCTGKVGVIGFCMGGDFALAMAPNPGVSAASVNYGGATGEVEQALPNVCPIVASYGAKDRSPESRLFRGAWNRCWLRPASSTTSRSIPARAMVS